MAKACLVCRDLICLGWGLGFRAALGFFQPQSELTRGEQQRPACAVRMWIYAVNCTHQSSSLNETHQFYSEFLIENSSHQY